MHDRGNMAGREKERETDTYKKKKKVYKILSWHGMRKKWNTLRRKLTD